MSGEKKLCKACGSGKKNPEGKSGIKRKFTLLEHSLTPLVFQHSYLLPLHLQLNHLISGKYQSV